MEALSAACSTVGIGRVMALVVAVSAAAVPVGMGAGGIAGEVWRAHLDWIFIACGVLIGVATAAAAASRRFRGALT